ncbi:MAG TPA: hypothetical protein PLI19_06560 [Erysipelotrichaceae bacterium]|nr:hypothetical protein [Erysipelotrichaceae bacterium]HQB32977.1 hypothetical protein [Erysipelotrichaceae bacterium]
MADDAQPYIDGSDELLFDERLSDTLRLAFIRKEEVINEFHEDKAQF